MSFFALPGHFLILLPTLNQYGNKDCTHILEKACVVNFEGKQMSGSSSCSIVCQKPYTTGEKKQRKKSHEELQKLLIFQDLKSKELGKVGNNWLNTTLINAGCIY